eukprot:CAMPEP_0117442364 /NCGR_PEP_ID=MMETSP0759-20121206/4111_1 /TAXON_ID=63605 /ORGANISM="Percolomonas cosmopolitus, Strain WS" /LENGTH=797 /DNA_ID=CAMNT_0005234245 /DNA_START=378 /DNA_END=2771 /DNA_ORIENTATION=+
MKDANSFSKGKSVGHEHTDGVPSGNQKMERMDLNDDGTIGAASEHAQNTKFSDSVIRGTSTKRSNFKESLPPLIDPSSASNTPSSTSQASRSSSATTADSSSPLVNSPYAPFIVQSVSSSGGGAQKYYMYQYHNRAMDVSQQSNQQRHQGSGTGDQVSGVVASSLKNVVESHNGAHSSRSSTSTITSSQHSQASTTTTNADSAATPLPPPTTPDRHQQAIGSIASRHRSTSSHLSNYYTEIQSQMLHESEYPRSNHELWSSLGTFMGSIVKGGMDIKFALERLDNLSCTKRIHLYLCQNVPNDLLLFQNYIDAAIRMEETVDMMNVTERVAVFLRDQLENVDNAHLRKKHSHRDQLWQYLFAILIRCTMMSSLDFQRFCSKHDIRRRQQIIEVLGFPLVWRVIRQRASRSRSSAASPKDALEKDQLLHAALLLLLRLTISTVNLESVREYSSNYYNVGQSGVDGAVQFSKYVETHEDKKRFWQSIDLLLSCNHTRLMTLYILFNIALFRRSISSIIGNMSLFSTLCKIMLDDSMEPVHAARDVMRGIVGIETSIEVFQHIAVGSPIYVISRGIASCNQDVYDKYFEKLVWNDVFLKRILEWGEVADSQCISNIARVLYSIAFRTTLKSEAYRTKFSTLLIDNYEGFSNVTGIQSISNLFVSQDTEVKIHSLLLLLSTVGYCDPKYHAIFLNFYHQNMLRTKQRQKELEFYQQEQNRVDTIIVKERLAYFTKLQKHSSNIAQTLTQQFDQVQTEYDETQKECKKLGQRTLLWRAGLLLPFVLASWVSFSVLRHRIGGE